MTTASTTRPVTPDIIDWINLNISRQCSAEGMIETLVQSGFTHNDAHNAVHRQIAEHRSHIADFTQSAFTIEDHTIRVALKCHKPKILLLDNVMTHDECDTLIELSTPTLVQSATVDKVTGNSIFIDERRSRSSYHGPFTDFFQKLDRRFSYLMNVPESHGEHLQVVNYEPGGEYRPHFDYFPPNESGSKIPLSNGGQRISTLIIYLNDVEEGGSTSFPEAKLTVQPRKGSGVYFHYMKDSGELDAMTLHSGDPVVAGTKWIVTKWMHERPRE